MGNVAYKDLRGNVTGVDRDSVGPNSAFEMIPLYLSLLCIHTHCDSLTVRPDRGFDRSRVLRVPMGVSRVLY